MNELTRFNVLLDTKYVVFDTLFPANLLLASSTAKELYTCTDRRYHSTTI